MAAGLCLGQSQEPTVQNEKVTSSSMSVGSFYPAPVLLGVMMAGVFSFEKIAKNHTRYGGASSFASQDLADFFDLDERPDLVMGITTLQTSHLNLEDDEAQRVQEARTFPMLNHGVSLTLKEVTV